ncbi:hypothetical protein ACIBXA_30745 [Micromonospora echinaurantiaca]|uniref:hypothetical protein n=1 Tax=Micromonospora TaxID=1873 RepID=UPI0011B71260|nr:hypothetical protein [Micromonospora sp. S4605]
MRVARVIAGLTTVTTAALGLSLVTAAGPAAAAERGAWRAYGNTNPITSSSSTWKCGVTGTVATNVVAQACAIRSVGGQYAQGAVIVRNNRSSLYSAAANTDLRNQDGLFLGEWECPSSGIAANSWSVCFGQTIYEYRSVMSEGMVNNGYLEWSPYV